MIYHILWPLGDPLPKLLKVLDLLKGVGLFSYVYEEFFLNSCQKLHDWLEINMALMVIECTLTKTAHIFDQLKNMAAMGWGLFFLWIYIWKLFKVFLSKYNLADYQLIWHILF